MQQNCLPITNLESITALPSAMAHPEHQKLLVTRRDTWNEWRNRNPEVYPDLSELDLRLLRTSNARLVFGATHDHTFDDYDFSGANLSRSYLRAHNIKGMKLRGAVLKECDLSGHDLSGMDLSGCDFTGANLSGCQLRNTNLSNANVSNTNLEFSVVADSILRNADLSNSNVYGISVWNSDLQDASQINLRITKSDEPDLIVDNIRLAQFMYLIINNHEIRDAIDTLTSKAVLILGRFTDVRMTVLEEVRRTIRHAGYIPLLFDFDKPASRTLTETIKTLASLSKFVIVDLSEAHSVPHELMSIVPSLPSVPVQPILEFDQDAYAMFGDLKSYPWVLPVIRYAKEESKRGVAFDDLLVPAEQYVVHQKRAKNVV